MSILDKIRGLFTKKQALIESEIKVTKQTKKVKQLTKEQLKAKQERANALLREQLAKEKEKQAPTKVIKDKPKQVTTVHTVSTRQKPKILSKQKEAENLATINNTVIYITATTKRLKVIEWRKLKKKTLLNKEREVRHTHKGGFSQEKFQHFVDSQKAKTADWVESNIKKHGVLRPPYDEIILDIKDEDVGQRVEMIIESLN